MTEAQVGALRGEDLKHFLPFAPAFVIELLTESESPRDTARKMQRWIENGVEVACMVNPYVRTVTIYETGGKSQVQTGPEVAGTGPVEGFVLEIGEV